MRTTGRSLAASIIVVLLAVTACGSDSKSSNSTASDSSVAPEDVKVDDATVTAGLKQMPATIAAAVASIGAADAKVKLDAIEELWASFEGTVRDKDATLYLAIEDQLTPLQRQIGDGDTAAATATATTMSGLFTEYLEKHPA